MKKKEYVFKMSNLIKNRVYYHAPISYKGDVDFDKILEKGIDLSYPVFIMEKPFKKELIDAFLEAQKFASFNLIIREKNKSIQKKIRRCYVVKQSEIPSLDKLNINYKSYSTYNKVEDENYIKIGGKQVDFEQKLFYLEQKGLCEDVFFNIKKYVLSGESVQIELTNTSKIAKSIEFEYNHVLERGYYSFDKEKDSLKITNLLNNSEVYLNANFGKINENYSCIDGLENSTFARINLKSKIYLKPFEKRNFFLNLGSKKFILKNLTEINECFRLSQKKNFEIFDVKVESDNKFFERNFNRTLPNKIWNAWLNGQRDLDSEDKYLSMKNNILLKNEKRFILGRNSYQLNNVFAYNGKDYVKIAKSN